MEEEKEETRIVITYGKKNISVFMNNPNATTKELLTMHCCFVSVLIKDMVIRGMTVSEALKKIRRSYKDTIKMYVNDMSKNKEC
ncbi:MAG: hypothetical protein K2G88_09000 [Oscillospiraceae bacterium]|nr:hypothetical protein [Oscillospiraceae bacterium]